MVVNFRSVAPALVLGVVSLFLPTMVHADVVIGLAGTLRVSFNASCIVIATCFAIL